MPVNPADIWIAPVPLDRASTVVLELFLGMECRHHALPASLDKNLLQELAWIGVWTVKSTPWLTSGRFRPTAPASAILDSLQFLRLLTETEATFFNFNSLIARHIIITCRRISLIRGLRALTQVKSWAFGVRGVLPGPIV